MKEIIRFLNNSGNNTILSKENINYGPYPDILPVILHKLKNKLTPILGYAQILQMKNTNSDLKKKIDKIERNASELTDLFDSLKDSLTIKKPVMERHNINTLIISEKKVFKDIRDKEIGLSLQLDDSIPVSNFVPRQFSLLLHSLIQNAITAIELKKSDDGEIVITTGQTDEMIYLRIRDNGVGIEEADIINIWTPFFSRFPGKGGVGLLTAEQAVSYHKGSPSVKSIPGSYSEFTFSFPYKKEVKDKEGKKQPLEKVNAVITGFDDDEISILNTIFSDFKNVSFHHTKFEDLEHGKVPENNPDIIFLNSYIVDAKENQKILKSIPDIFPDSEIIIFCSNSKHLLFPDILDKDNIRLVPDGTKILTIINILAKAMNKEK